MEHRKIKTTKSTRVIPRVIIITIATCLVLGLLFAALETTGVTNIVQKNEPNSQLSNDAGSNKINYDPPTKEEADLGNQIKDQAQHNESNLPTTADGSIAVVYSTASQDDIGGPIIIRTIVSATSGNCAATLSSSNFSKDYSSTVKDLGSYYSCNFDIPVDAVPAGSYTLVVSAKNDSSSGSATQTIEVRK